MGETGSEVCLLGQHTACKEAFFRSFYVFRSRFRTLEVILVSDLLDLNELRLKAETRKAD